MNGTYLKFGAAALLFLLWTALVCTNHADQGLIDAIKFALGSLGFYHAATNLQGNNQLALMLQTLQAKFNPPAAAPAPAPSPSAEVIAASVAAALAQHQNVPQAPINFPPAPKEPA